MKVLSFFTLLLFLGCGLARAQGTSGIDQNNPDASRDKVNLFISNAFTPNQDGVNDYFYIPPGTAFSDFSIKVMDRWGIEVYSSEDSNFRWDGNMRGRELATGTYVYVLTGTTAQGQSVKRSGTVSLVR
jgi:gliding motility-associated-like protein